MKLNIKLFSDSRILACFSSIVFDFLFLVCFYPTFAPPPILSRSFKIIQVSIKLLNLFLSALKARFEQKPEDGQDLIKPKFGNKGNFYNRFPVSPTNSTTIAPNLAKLQSPSPTGPGPKPFSSPSPTINKSFGYTPSPKPAITTPSPKPTPAFKNFKSTPVRPQPKKITPPPSPEPTTKTFSQSTNPLPNFNSTFSSAPKSLDSPPAFNKTRNSSSSSGGNAPVRPNMVRFKL